MVFFVERLLERLMVWHDPVRERAREEHYEAIHRRATAAQRRADVVAAYEAEQRTLAQRWRHPRDPA